MKKGKKSGVIGGVIAAIIIGILVIQFSSINEDAPIQDNDLPEIVDVDNDLPEIVDVDNDGIPDDVDPYIATPRVWEKQTSGPFQIDKEQYVLSELVLIRMNELDLNDKGQIVFLRPSNGTHQIVYITIPFDGSEKLTFNQYFKPSLSISAGTCSKADLLGNWTVVFQNTNYNQLKFEIVDRIIPGDEEDYEKIIC